MKVYGILEVRVLFLVVGVLVRCSVRSAVRGDCRSRGCFLLLGSIAIRFKSFSSMFSVFCMFALPAVLVCDELKLRNALLDFL